VQAPEDRRDPAPPCPACCRSALVCRLTVPEHACSVSSVGWQVQLARQQSVSGSRSRRWWRRRRVAGVQSGQCVPIRARNSNPRRFNKAPILVALKESCRRLERRRRASIPTAVAQEAWRTPQRAETINVSFQTPVALKARDTSLRPACAHSEHPTVQKEYTCSKECFDAYISRQLLAVEISRLGSQAATAREEAHSALFASREE